MPFESCLVLCLDESKATDSLLDRDGIGCFDLRAGRTAEVVASSDGIEWDSPWRCHEILPDRYVVHVGSTD